MEVENHLTMIHIKPIYYNIFHDILFTGLILSFTIYGRSGQDRSPTPEKLEMRQDNLVSRF